jgi:small subunit ribosomal protein S4
VDLSLKRFRPFGKQEREFPPGQHGTGRRRAGRSTDYGLQLQEKQKLRYLYGILERQLRTYYKKAAKMHGATGENLVHLLEKRLDNVVFRMGFALTRAQARQLVRHGHFTVNGNKVDIPSYQVREGDKIEIRESSRNIPNVELAWNMAGSSGQVLWVTRDAEGYKATFDRLPTLEECNIPVKETLIVEYYSR